MGGSILLIVESPTKARTIKKLLKNRLIVLSSRGHIKDLPKSRLGVNIEQNFEPHYIRIRGKAEIIKELRAAAERAKAIYLGTDPDREGEAIAYHIFEEIKNGKNIKRVLFYEITRQGIEQALQNPTAIDLKKVDSHKARRVLDRLVGYLVSPMLWQVLKKGLSAGRVQTVALRLICEREKEIRDFIPKEYWTIKVKFQEATNQEFVAELVEIGDKECNIPNEETAQKIKKDLLDPKLKYHITKVNKTEQHRVPLPPFITSTLQQEASRRLGFSAQKTMVIAQQLFEGIELKDEATGLITYPRTDSVRIGEEFINKTRSFIKNEFGESYLPKTARIFKDRKQAQAAHEAIRPTAIARTPESIKEYLSKDQFRLYDLIYRRFLASQMADAVYSITSVTITGGDYKFSASAIKQKFDGFEKVYGEPQTEKVLPLLKEGDEVFLKEVNPEQHFTQPPPRYTEGTLVKKLEINGIGRPSTYATIVSTLFERGYVRRIEGRLQPTELGFLVTDILIPRFSDIFEVNFTKEMEEELDLIEAGEKDWQEVVRRFYEPFSNDLDKVQKELPIIKTNMQTLLSEECPKCGKPLVARWGKFGKFIACSNYPNCKYIKKESPKLLAENCPQCQKPLVERTSRYGKFIACSDYPNCKYIKKESPKELKQFCPQCGKPLIERFGRYGKFIACSNYPNCKYTVKMSSEKETTTPA
ncbi:MAG: type I DNA topoisomerase [candidate division WOR-3 bacterium]